MITLFEEEDMVSFGNYMISEARKRSITENPEITNQPTRKMLLGQATQYDMENWVRLIARAEQEEYARKEQEARGVINKLENKEDYEGEMPEIDPENWEDATTDNTVQLNPNTED